MCMNTQVKYTQVTNACSEGAENYKISSMSVCHIQLFRDGSKHP